MSAKNPMNRLALVAVLSAAAVIGCDRQEPISAVARQSATSPVYNVVVADPDSVMGSLSPIAQFIAAGLQDSAVRMAINHSLKAAGAHPMGLDLQLCADDPSIIRLLSAGEKRGVGMASATCATLSRMPGAVLYMDHSRLQKWDGTTVPIVTAIAKPGHRLPQTFRGYRSPNRLIDLPADGSLQGPIFVVLPYPHPAHPRSVRLGAPAIRNIKPK